MHRVGYPTGMVFLGLDVGGTRLRWACRPGGSGEGPGVQPAVHGEAAAAEQLATVLRAIAGEAGGAIRQAVVAMAGAGDRALAARLQQGLAERGVAFPVAIVGDTLAAAAAALTHGPGALVWAGTGSFAVARAADGALHRVGGRGYLLGDDGSAYDLVRNAARRALRAHDGLGPATSLTAALTAAFGAPAPERLGASLQQLDTGAVAARFGVVLAEAAAGDAVARDVLATGAGELAGLVRAAAARAGLDLRGHAVAFGGGALTGAPALREGLAAALADAGIGPLRMLPPHAAVAGAVALAEAFAGGRQPLAGWVAHGAL